MIAVKGTLERSDVNRLLHDLDDFTHRYRPPLGSGPGEALKTQFNNWRRSLRVEISPSPGYGAGGDLRAPDGLGKGRTARDGTPPLMRYVGPANPPESRQEFV